MESTIESEVPLPPLISGTSNNRYSENSASNASSTAATPGQAQESVSADQHMSQSYGNYVNLFGDEWEDDDEELAAAIAASIEDQSSCDEIPCGSANEQVSIADVIGNFIAINLQAKNGEAPSNILINRKEILTTTLRAMQRKRFSFVKPVSVTFSGEDAVDKGGPRREYFRLLMVALQSMGVFQGKWFSHDLELLSTKKYELAGKLIAWSILQGGPGPRCLAKEAFLIMKGYSVSFNVAIEAVRDEELKAVLKDVDSCSSQEDFNNLKCDVIARYGYSRIYTSSVAQKDEILLALLKQAFVFSVHAEMEQFWDGMNSIGKLGDLVNSFSNLFEALLCDNATKLDLAAFRCLYKVMFPPDGSNQRNVEEKTIYCLEVFLQDLDEGQVDKLCLEDILVFITGADAVPPLGFDHKISIAFYDQEEAMKRFPWSSTCSLSLYLPRGIFEPEEFNSLMSQALLNCQGFGKC